MTNVRPSLAIHRGQFQIRLRGLFAFVTLCALASKLASHAVDYSHERRELARLSAIGSTTYIDTVYDGGPLRVFR